MVLNDRSLTNEKDGLSNSINLTNQDFYICLVDEKNKENNSVLAGHSFSLLRSFLTFLPFYGLPCRLWAARIVSRTEFSNQAINILKWPTLEERQRKSVFKLIKKCLQGQCPQYFKQYVKQYFKRNDTIHTRQATFYIHLL